MTMLTVQRLDYDDAARLIEGAETKAAELGIPMCIAVVDESGHKIAFKRMDGAKQLSVQLSDDKAFTAAVSKRATHEYNADCQPGNIVFGIHTSSGGRFSTVGGGYPVVADGIVVGGIGVSGGHASQDMECAEAGIAFWNHESKALQALT